MYEGQPFKLSSVLPRGMSTDDFYITLMGVLALGCVLAIGISFANYNPMTAKVKAIKERRRSLKMDAIGPKKRKSPEVSVNFMRSVVTRFSLLKKNQMGKTEALLIEAGFRSRDAIYILTFFNLLAPIVLGMIGFLYMQVLPQGDGTIRTIALRYLWPVMGMYIGLKLPTYYVKSVRKKRYNNIQKALSDTLDLMTICAEAGLSLAVMLDRVSRELAMTYPEISQELLMTSIEIGFLPDRNKALSNLAERCTLQEVRGIVSVLIQTEKYGTPIAQALRVLSAEFRQTRMLRAEQKAARLPALMTVPMILFILPTLFIIIIAPAAVKVMDLMK
jgi:tight adherence protein C